MVVLAMLGGTAAGATAAATCACSGASAATTTAATTTVSTASTILGSIISYIPSIVTITLSAICGPLVTNYIFPIYCDHHCEAYRIDNAILRRVVKKPLPVRTKDMIRNDQLITALKEMMVKPKMCEVFVIAAPPGSGKTMYMAVAINELLMLKDSNYKLPHLKIFYNEGLDLDYFTRIGIPEGYALRDFLPADSIVVFDQVDMPSLDAAQCAFITRIATQAHNSCGHFRIVFQVSNATIGNQILTLTKGKSSLGVHPSLYRSTGNELAKFQNTLLQENRLKSTSFGY